MTSQEDKTPALYNFILKIIDKINNNYIYIIIFIILSIIIYIFYNNIYNYIYNILSFYTVENKIIQKFNQISNENNIYDDNLIYKNSYDKVFKNNIKLYKQNLNTRLSYIKNNIDNSIKHHLSLSKPNYSLILFMKQYKEKLDHINVEKNINISLIEKDLENINNNIINLLLN